MSTSTQKSKPLALILSFFISGLGLLYVDAGKNWWKFLIAFLLVWLIVPWLAGLFCTNNEVNRVNGT